MKRCRRESDWKLLRFEVLFCCLNVGSLGDGGVFCKMMSFQFFAVMVVVVGVELVMVVVLMPLPRPTLQLLMLTTMMIMPVVVAAVEDLVIQASQCEFRAQSCELESLCQVMNNTFCSTLGGLTLASRTTSLEQVERRTGMGFLTGTNLGHKQVWTEACYSQGNRCL